MKRQWIVIVALLTCWPTVGRAQNQVKDLKKAVERSTLDQPGTKPFHLKATIEPSFDRDKLSGRTGSVEIWWASPAEWKRELRSPEFHQVQIVNGSGDWQKSEGDYFPQWLQQTAIELVTPVPPLEEVLEQARKAEVGRMGPMTNLSWTTQSGTAEVHNILRSSVAWGSNGLMLYAHGLGWGGEFKDYADFHGRMVARSVNVGTPQVTARITVLEDLGETAAGFFDASIPGGDPHPLKTVLMNETTLRINLQPMGPITWPALQDGPLEGNVTTQVIVDREGRVRDIGTVVSENQAINDAGKMAVLALRFKPFLVDGVPAQAMSQLTIPFKTVRPAGSESFDSARTYFEHGRHIGFPAYGNGTAYVLRAEFETRGRDGAVVKGRYEDTWLSQRQWRREASFSKSRYVRSRDGDQTYQVAEGEDAGLLAMVMRIMEPIPAIDTFVESDWRIKRDAVNGVSAVRVLSGYESPDGKLDAEQARGYWFDESGSLIKTYFNGIETERSEFQEFAGVKVASQIGALRDGKLAMKIHVTEISPAGNVQASNFELKGHEWTRAFTSEVR